MRHGSLKFLFRAACHLPSWDACDMWLGRCSDLLATLIPEGVMERLREAPPGEMVAGEVSLLQGYLAHKKQPPPLGDTSGSSA